MSDLEISLIGIVVAQSIALLFYGWTLTRCFRELTGDHALLSDDELSALLRLHMANDPNILTLDEEEAMADLLGKEVRLRGYTSRLEAYHDMEGEGI